MRWKPGDKVRCGPGLRAIAPRYRAPGTVAEISTDPYWVGKGTPVGVVFDYGPEPAGWEPSALISKWPRYMTMYFAEDELEQHAGVV